jgi:hypothetical protein
MLVITGTQGKQHDGGEIASPHLVKGSGQA